MIVGAPLDNITSALLMSKNVEHPGTVYRCNIARGGDCEPIIVDQNYSYVDTFNDQSKLVRTERDILENQWLGSSVAAIKQGTVTATEKATTGLIIVSPTVGSGLICIVVTWWPKTPIDYGTVHYLCTKLHYMPPSFFALPRLNEQF
jgi:hypothetical protein